ncbi:MAG: hypothetical protein ACKVU1_07830 [bacterium]
MRVRRWLTALLVTIVISSGVSAAFPREARADAPLDPWILYLILLEGDPDTPDLIVKNDSGDPVFTFEAMDGTQKIIYLIQGSLGSILRLL